MKIDGVDGEVAAKIYPALDIASDPSGTEGRIIDGRLLPILKDGVAAKEDTAPDHFEFAFNSGASDTEQTREHILLPFQIDEGGSDMLRPADQEEQHIAAHNDQAGAQGDVNGDGEVDFIDFMF